MGEESPLKFEYVTFDCYGTLIDWRAGIERSLREALGDVKLTGGALLGAYLSAEMEEEKSYKSYRDVLSGAASRLSGPLGGEVSPEAAAVFADSVPSWPAFEDSREALRELGRRGYRRYILSNVDDDQLLATIENNGLEVDGFVTAQEVRGYKPGAAHWNRFMQKTGAARGEFLHVAQSVFHDVLPTQEMGISSAWINRYDEPLPPSAQPAYIADSLAGLLRAIE
jgi:2-haloacid dehalogenase